MGLAGRETTEDNLKELLRWKKLASGVLQRSVSELTLVFSLITLAFSVLLTFTNDSELSSVFAITKIFETLYGKLLKTRDGIAYVTR